jgi:hypothetical protein
MSFGRGQWWWPLTAMCWRAVSAARGVTIGWKGTLSPFVRRCSGGFLRAAFFGFSEEGGDR